MGPFQKKVRTTILINGVTWGAYKWQEINGFHSFFIHPYWVENLLRARTESITSLVLGVTPFFCGKIESSMITVYLDLFCTGDFVRIVPWDSSPWFTTIRDNIFGTFFQASKSRKSKAIKFPPRSFS